MKSVLRPLLLLLIIGAAGGCFPKKLDPLTTTPAPTTDPARISAVNVKGVYASIVTLTFSVENPQSVTEYGYVYSTDKAEPTRDNSTDIIRLGSAPPASAVTASIFGLKPKTGYFIAPFVKDAAGYKYGQAVKVETKPFLDVLINPGPNSTGPPSSTKGFVYVFSSLFMLNDDLYAITNDVRKGYGYGALQAFSLSGRQWRTASFPTNGLNSRTDATAFVHAGKAYVGFGTGNATDIYSYQADRWEQLKPPSSSANVPALEAVGGIGYSFNSKAYVWNGTWTAKSNPGAILWNDGTYGKVVRSDHIPFWEYDQNSGAWNLVRAKATPDFFATLRQSPFHFVIDDRLYLGGGQNLHDPQRRSEIWELNLRTLEVRSVAKLPGTFVYDDSNLSNGNHRNLAVGLQGAGWKRGYFMDVRGNLFMMDVSDVNNVKVTATGERPGNQGVLVGNGERLFYLQAGQDQQVIEIFP